MEQIAMLVHSFCTTDISFDDVAILITPEQDAAIVKEWNERHNLLVHFFSTDYPVKVITTMHRAKYAGYLIIVKESA